MATFEKRLDAQGKVQAIRVKVRRVGLPHLSRTFPVEGTNNAAVREAERQAKQWVASLRETLEAGERGDALPARQDVLRQAWQSVAGQPGMSARGYAAMPSEAIQSSKERPLSEADLAILLSCASAPAEQALIQFILETGLSLDALASLRWQQVHLDTARLEVRGAGGLVSRQIPLSTATLDALLTMGGRKYGLIFSDARQLEIRLRENLAEKGHTRLAARFSLDTLRREAAWRLLEQGQSNLDVARYLGVADLESFFVRA